MNFMLLLVIWFGIVVIYYKYIKRYLINLSPSIAIILNFSKKYTLQEAVGIVELILIALSHGILCIFLLYTLNIDLDIGLKQATLTSVLYGILLGIGEMSFSSLLCLLLIRFLQSFFSKDSPNEEGSWNALSRGGWIRHHIHTMNNLHFLLAFPIICVQISAEEIIFRGIIQNQFLCYGPTISAMISIFLFVYMQTFHMPSKLSALFPVIGSSVMGLVHSYLFSTSSLIFPLIIAHVTFFIMSVI